MPRASAGREKNRTSISASPCTITRRGEDSAAENLEVDVLDLDLALQRLGEVKPRYLELMELRFFGGLSLEEVAEVLDVSRTIVVRELAKARTWLTRFLREA